MNEPFKTAILIQCATATMYNITDTDIQYVQKEANMTFYMQTMEAQ